jgi:hypothetical protein
MKQGKQEDWMEVMKKMNCKELETGLNEGERD